MIKTYSLRADGNRNLSPHFKVKEFRCKDGSDTILIDTDLIPILESLYINLNAKSVNITSGYRTPSWSVKVGGYATDKHTKGMAVDIKVKDKNNKYMTAEKILTTYEGLGYKGGSGYINRYTVHIDTRNIKTWFVEPRNYTVQSWFTHFNKPPFFYQVIESIDPDNLNIRLNPTTENNKPVFNVPYGTRFIIDSIRGALLHRGCWCHIYRTDYWVTGSGELVKTV